MKQGNLKNLQVKLGGDFTNASPSEGSEVSLRDKYSPKHILRVHAVGISLHGLDANLGFLRKKDINLVAGVVLLGLVDDEVLTLHVFAILVLELAFRHVDLEIANEETPVAEHLHHRLPYMVQPRDFLLRKHLFPIK